MWLNRFLKLYKNIDLLLLQEIKAIDFKLDINMRCIWRDVYFTTNHCKGKGGVAILLSHKWEKCISRWGWSPFNKAVWVILKIKDVEFEACLVYAANDYKEKTNL